jgi:methylmalonyl-CoA carboxyltransferase 12S subunit
MSGKELAADGVVTGCATIDGCLVHLASQDFTVAVGLGLGVAVSLLKYQMRESYSR